MAENGKFLCEYEDQEAFTLSLVQRAEYRGQHPTLDGTTYSLTEADKVSHITGHTFFIIGCLLEASMDESIGVELDMGQVVQAFQITNTVLEAYELPSLTQEDVSTAIPILTGLNF